MKLSFLAASVALVAVSSANAADVSPASEPQLPTSEQAYKAVQEIDLPAGLKLTGTTEPIPKSAATAAESSDVSAIQTHHEQLGIGGWGGLGWGGWGGFGPYRFGYSCGGLGGWAYPLGYWNAFGAGLWGGGCGLGLAYGGLFYC